MILTLTASNGKPISFEWGPGCWMMYLEENKLTAVSAVGGKEIAVKETPEEIRKKIEEK